MEDCSIFMEKENIPTRDDLQKTLGNCFDWWNEIEQYVLTLFPQGISEWNYPGKKFGWSYRIKDSKRAIVYLLPRDGYFKVAFVFGDKAVEEIVQSNMNDSIKSELLNTKKYMEGRGIRIEVKNKQILEDIYTLIEIKLKY
jgi:hypothetical protein